MITILSSIIGIVARGSASKAIAGSLSGAILTGSGPLLDVFSKGLVAGAGPQIEALGFALGQAVIGGLVGYVISWLAPANKSKTS